MSNLPSKSKMILEKDKKEICEKDALQICFKQIKPSLMDDKDLYNRFREYRRRYNDDDKILGFEAKQSILNHFGFKFKGTVYIETDDKK